MEAKQLSLFDFPKLEINKPIRLIELFGGIGSQAMALRDIGADFEHYKLVEFDKYAVQSYNAIHGTQHVTHDIRQIHASDLEIKDKDKYCYLMTYSFPCTDLSVAGKMQGMSKTDWENGNSTRSGLLWEVERILKECKREELPQILLMENVPQVHAEQNKADFESWLSFLRTKGYVNHWKDLNAKNYGIPQNRERCFCVSILADEFVDYEFPAPMPLTTVMKDFLEETVDEKYYINNEKAQKLIALLVESGVLAEQNRTEQIVRQSTSVSSSLEKSRLQTASRQDMTPESQTCRQTAVVLLSNQGTKFEKVTEVANCLMARDYKGFGNQVGNGVIEMTEVKVIGQMDNTLDNTLESANRVYDKEALCPTIPTCCGGGIQPKVIEDTKCVGGLSDDKWGTQYHQQDRVYKGDIALALPSQIPEGSYKYIVAMRGRNPERPTDRTPGLPTEQRLEMNTEGLVNILTTVQKDNMVLEKKIQTLSAGCHGYANAHICVKEKPIVIDYYNKKQIDGDICGTLTAHGNASSTSAGTFLKVEIKQATKEGSIKCKVGGCFDSSFPDSKTRRGRVQNDGDVVPTLTASNSENINYVKTQYRIRKLTPKECWRLMGYTDEDFEKASKVNSNTQLYKQAGNAIVKQVLMAIFAQMIPSTRQTIET